MTLFRITGLVGQLHWRLCAQGRAHSGRIMFADIRAALWNRVPPTVQQAACNDFDYKDPAA